MYLSLNITLAIFASSLAFTVLCGWLGARPVKLGQPRMVPWQFLMMLSAAVALYMVVHLLGVIGAKPNS